MHANQVKKHMNKKYTDQDLIHLVSWLKECDDQSAEVYIYEWKTELRESKSTTHVVH